MIPSVVVILRRLKVLRVIRRSKVSYIAMAFLASTIINGLLFYVTEGVIGGREDLTIWRSMYWAVVTMATVGYGDITPTTFWGTVVTIETVIVGIAVFTMMVSTLAEEFMSRSIRRSMGLGKLRRVDVLVIGGEESCREAVEELLINLPKARIGWLLPEAPKSPPAEVEFVAGDPADDEVLKRAAADKADKIIVCLNDPSKAVHTVLTLRRINRKAKVVCLASNMKVKALLEEAGANYVVPAKLLGRLLASATFEPAVVEFLTEVTTARGVADLMEYSVGSESVLSEVISRLSRGSEFNYVALAIKKGDKLIVSPEPEMRLVPGDKVVFLRSRKTT